MLGSLELVGADGAIPVGAAKQRRLLAALTVAVGTVVPGDVLIDAVWGATPPVSARKLLQVYVSQLRKALPAGARVRTSGGGCALELGECALDAARFERLLGDGLAAAAAGNPTLAAALLDRALGLWRGPAFGELAYEQFARGEAERLEELRVLAREERIAAQLALGRGAAVLAELSSLARAEPLRERLQALWMLALYRSGRQTEALEVYTAAHARLRDELGLEPGVELRELQQRILRHDPSLASSSDEQDAEASLPAAPNALLGRERELAQLCELLLGEEVRLLVLTGAGGSGKTRLALEAARRCAGAFANGGVFVALAPLRDPSLVIGTIARACGLQQLADEHSIQALADALSARELLLVLDNFEHLRAAAPHLVELLARAPRLRLLVTSRAVLHVSGEHVYPVEPLAIDAACALFTARAIEADPRFAPDAENHNAIARICARLDGLPLAVELAAARTNILTPTQLLDRLDPALPLLTGGPRDLPAHQQTLRATLDWSHKLLTADQQRLFRRLAVFDGGFDLDAAEDVCGGDLPTLGALVEQSLVRRVADERFAMLETIRERALEELKAAGEETGMRARHAIHMLAVARSANLRDDSEGEQRYGLIVTERDNIRSALRWALEGGETELGLELAVALELFWLAHAVQEGKGWFDVLLDRQRSAPPALRAGALRACGTLTRFAGDLDGGEALYEQSLAAHRTLADQHGVGILLMHLAACAGEREEITRARELAEESLEILDRVGSQSDQAGVRAVLGGIEWDDHHHDRGLQLLEQAVAIAESIGLGFWQALWLDSLCEHALELGRIETAEARGRQALALCRSIGDRQTPLHILTLLAHAALERGDPTQAGQLWGAVETEMTRADPGWWLLSPPDSRYNPEKHVAPLRSAHDPQFQHGRTLGQRLSLDKIIEYVLKPLEADNFLASEPLDPIISY